MRPAANPPVHPADVQTNQSGSTPPHPARWNALKHGLRSTALVLPGEDAAAFERLRQSLHRAYRPLTPVEDRCVERMAACEWRMGRWQRWEAGLNQRLDDLLTEGPDGPAAQQAEPDAHYWEHRSVDCTLQEGRLERSLLRTERRLLELQRLRRNRLLAPASTDRLEATAPQAPEAPLSGSSPAPAVTVPSACSPGPSANSDKPQEILETTGSVLPQTRPDATVPWVELCPGPPTLADSGSGIFKAAPSCRPAPLPWVPLRVAQAWGDVSSPTPVAVVEGTHCPPQ